MVPAYRPDAKYFRQALESVLQQDPGPGRMQIEVVDDCSPESDVESGVKSISAKRITYSRTPKNLGLAGCWNTCIERSRGQWVHILHQDDFVLPGFYSRLEEASRVHPEVSLLATRSNYVDKEGITFEVSTRVRDLENGGRSVGDLLYCMPIQCPGVAVKRAFYEAQGGFRSDLVFTLDCEMWTRVISSAGGLVTPEVFACYRMADTNETGRLNRTGETLRDLDRMNQIFAGRHAGFDSRKANEIVCYKAIIQSEKFSRLGDAEAARANLDYWRSHAPAPLRLRRFAVNIARRIFG
jgi:glycosyltransferase involved in cell wall biosynthesis